MTETLIFNYIREYKELKKKIGSLQDAQLQCRKDIIMELEKIGVSEMKNNGDSAKYTIPKTFDESKFAQENPETHKFYCHTETIENIVFDKKSFKKDYPKIYESYQKEMSGRLTIK